MAGYLLMTLFMTILKIGALVGLIWLIVTAVKNKRRQEEWEPRTKKYRTLAWVIDIAAILILLN